jgi:hypothetical protein
MMADTCSSTDSLPSWISCQAAADVIAFVQEKMQ